MFNFESAQNVTNIRSISSIDVKVYSNHKIRIGDDARVLLSLPTNNVLILKDSSNNLVIAGVSAEGEGRKVNNLGDFNHQALSGLLGGKDSVWKINRDNKITHPITQDVYYSLIQVLSENVIPESEEDEIEILEEIDTV